MTPSHDQALRLGAFLMPSHPPERVIAATHAEDLGTLVRLDALGFYEAWVGEHFTAAWEPCVAPDLLVAQALLCTKQIRLGPLGHLLPYHHPITLAHRAAYLDQIAAGRYQLGVGISALPSDRELFAVPGGGVNRRMTFESLDIMTSLWTGQGKPFRGEFWHMGSVSQNGHGLAVHLRPFNGAQPVIAIAGMAAGSENHRLAGEKGYLPVSLGVDADGSITAQHWHAVEQGAARSGKAPARRDWRVVRDVVVARSDAEAMDLARDSMMGRCWRDFLIPLYRELGQSAALLAGSDLPPSASDDEIFEHVAKELWICGSPESVTKRLQHLELVLGGFGVLLTPCYDVSGAAAEWDLSHTLLSQAVVPQIQAVHSLPDALTAA